MFFVIVNEIPVLCIKRSSICPIGYYCPANTTAPIGCSPGSYANTTGQSFAAWLPCRLLLIFMHCTASCSSCPPGFYCPSSTGDFTQHPCPGGYWCSSGQSSGTVNPCPAGTYSVTVGLSQASQCASCPPGKYCGTSALPAPSGNCTGGYYCTGGSTTPTPSSGLSLLSRCWCFSTHNPF